MAFCHLPCIYTTSVDSILGNANPITRLPNPLVDRQLVNLVSPQE